jgi:hypothetical protein
MIEMELYQQNTTGMVGGNWRYIAIVHPAIYFATSVYF